MKPLDLPPNHPLHRDAVWRTDEPWSNPVAGITDAIPERLAKQHQEYIAVYGIRADDQAMVFHFYPPGTDFAAQPQKIGTWGQEWRMDERLERAIPHAFKVEFVKAVYTAEMKSFCIIVRGLGHSPDPWFFVHRFFEKIDAPL